MTELNPVERQKTTMVKSHEDYANDFQAAASRSLESGVDVFIDYAQGIAARSYTALDIAFAHAVRNIAYNMPLNEHENPEACAAIGAARKKMNIL